MLYCSELQKDEKWWDAPARAAKKGGMGLGRQGGGEEKEGFIIGQVLKVYTDANICHSLYCLYVSRTFFSFSFSFFY